MCEPLSFREVVVFSRPLFQRTPRQRYFRRTTLRKHKSDSKCAAFTSKAWSNRDQSWLSHFDPALGAHVTHIVAASSPKPADDKNERWTLVRALWKSPGQTLHDEVFTFSQSCLDSAAQRETKRTNPTSSTRREIHYLPEGCKISHFPGPGLGSNSRFGAASFYHHRETLAFADSQSADWPRPPWATYASPNMFTHT